MTPVQRTAAIKNLCSSNLPALLTAAGLDDFSEYLNKSPLKSDDKELCVYIDMDGNSTDRLEFGVLIQAQLYGEDQVQEYHSVIMPFLENNLSGDVVGFTERTNISSDVWPMEPGGATAFIYYTVQFSKDIDDCYES